jgi:hypothetical protein
LLHGGGIQFEILLSGFTPFSSGFLFLGFIFLIVRFLLFHMQIFSQKRCLFLSDLLYCPFTGGSVGIVLRIDGIVVCGRDVRERRIDAEKQNTSIFTFLFSLCHVHPNIFFQVQKASTDPLLGFWKF